MIKNFVCVFLIVTIATIVFADYSIEKNILSRCKYVECKDVADLSLEAKIRQCVKTTCTSVFLKSLAEECKRDCKDEIKSRPRNMPHGEAAKIIDYDWLD